MTNSMMSAYGHRSVTPAPAMMGAHSEIMNDPSRIHGQTDINAHLRAQQQSQNGFRAPAAAVMPTPGFGILGSIAQPTQANAQTFFMSEDGIQMLLTDSLGRAMFSPKFVFTGAAGAGGNAIASTSSGTSPRSKLTLGRPDNETMRRRREASFAAMDVDERDQVDDWVRPMRGNSSSSPVRGSLIDRIGNGRSSPLLDRIRPQGFAPYTNGHRRKNNGWNDNRQDGWRQSDNPTPGIPPTRSDGTNPSDEGFARPYSRLSQRMEGMDKAQIRPFSSNSMRSSMTGASRGRDSWYPMYDKTDKCVGSRPRIPPEEKRPFYTPAPEDEVAAVVVKNLTEGTTVQDAQVCFAEIADVQSCEIVDRPPDNTLSVLVVYNQKDDADRAVQQLHGIAADGHVLQVISVNPRSIARPNRDSLDSDLRVGFLPKQKTKDSERLSTGTRSVSNARLYSEDQTMVEQTPS